MSQMEPRTFQGAVAFLRGRAPKLASTSLLPTIQPTSLPPNGSARLKGIPASDGMRQWLKDLGHSSTDIDKLNIIHVTRTKGKGSTCALSESLLRAHGRRTGLYTSPHIIQMNERIRINFEPLSENLFAKYTFEVADKLSLDKNDRPRMLQLLFLIAIHTFILAKVDVAIVEVHHGGQYDATNCIQHPSVTAITPVGMDHVDELGPTIKDIAWHKSGIFKTGTMALSAPQNAEVAEVLVRRAEQESVTLQFIGADNDLQRKFDTVAQKRNFLLAREVSNAYLQSLGQTLSDEDIEIGLKQYYWPGRFEIIKENDTTWFLDGAHETLSIDVAISWFKAKRKHKSKIVIYSHMSDRHDGKGTMIRLAKGLPAQHVVFSSYRPVTSKDVL